MSDHKLYHSVYSENPEAFTMSILRSTRYNPGSVYNTPPAGGHPDAWDARPSLDEGAGFQEDKVYEHQRDSSNASGRYEDSFTEGSQVYPNDERAYGEEQEYGYGGGQGQYPFSTPGGGYVDHPVEARSRDPGQTPTMNQYQPGRGVGFGGGDGGLRRPDGVQSHPGGLQRSGDGESADGARI